MTEVTREVNERQFALVVKSVLSPYRKYGAKKGLAGELGIDCQTLGRWIRGNRGKIHADKLGALCKATNDFRLLDQLEHQVGRKAFSVLPEDTAEWFPRTAQVKSLVELMKQITMLLGKALEDRPLSPDNVEMIRTNISSIAATWEMALAGVGVDEKSKRSSGSRVAGAR